MEVASWEAGDERVARDDQIQGIQHQLEYWQDNVATRVADEAKALALEISKLRNHELDEVWDLLRTANDQVHTGTDILRDLRRRLQDRQAPA